MMKRVLVIDDNVRLCEAVQRHLKLDGHDVTCVFTAPAALELLDRTADDRLPELIITDYEMPYMSGFEFRRDQLKQERLAGIPTIMWTGCDPRDLLDELKELPLTVLAKPVDMFELRHYVFDH